MKHVLIYDSNPSCLRDILMDLPSYAMQHVKIEEVNRIYQVINKLLFPHKNGDNPTFKRGFDLLIVGFSSTMEDMQKIQFMDYIKENKPGLPILIFLYSEKERLIEQVVISKNRAFVKTAGRNNIKLLVEAFLEKGVLE